MASPRCGWKAAAEVREGVKVEVSQARPAIAMRGRGIAALGDRKISVPRSVTR
jgi:hypothetical protein